MPPAGGKKSAIIFSRDMCVRENTSQTASVEFVRHRHTNSAHSRLQAFCQKRASPFLDKSLAVCRAHNWFDKGEPIPHLQTEKNFRPGTRPGRKWIAFDLPPAGGKLCEAFLKSCPARLCLPQGRAGDFYQYQNRMGYLLVKKSRPFWLRGVKVPTWRRPPS